MNDDFSADSEKPSAAKWPSKAFTAPSAIGGDAGSRRTHMKISWGYIVFFTGVQ